MRSIGHRILVWFAAAGILVSCGEKGLPGRMDPKGTESIRVIRKPDWKQVYRMHTGVMELSLLRKDIGESEEIAAPDENQE